jgi:hypothetical protein
MLPDHLITCPIDEVLLPQQFSAGGAEGSHTKYHNWQWQRFYAGTFQIEG